MLLTVLKQNKQKNQVITDSGTINPGVRIAQERMPSTFFSLNNCINSTFDIRDSGVQTDDANMHWNFKDQLDKVDLGGGGNAYYVYDATGQRIRKVHEHIGELVEERIYIWNSEIYRKHPKHNPTDLIPERETLHIIDGMQRVASVDIRTIDKSNEDQAFQKSIRYQYGNHLGSCCLELDEEAKIISYEEYYPYGGTSYHAVRSHTELPPKRYRYSERERDEETG